MALFPMFVDLSDKNALLVGGGEVATRKLKTLLHFKPKVTVISKDCTEFIENLAQNGKIVLYKREFEPENDIKGRDLVIVAVDSIKLQRVAYNLCKEKSIPINCVDSPEFCSFIFPSVIVRDDFVVGISTSGKAPLVSRKTREALERIIPKNISAIVKGIEKIRQSHLVKGEKRKEMDRYIRKLRWNC